MATGTLTVTNRSDGLSAIKVFELAWTSDGSGNVDQYTPASPRISGELIGIKVLGKDADGNNVPGGTHTVTLKDADGFDVLAGLGTSVAAAVALFKAACIIGTDGTNSGPAPIPIDGLLRLEVSGAGAAKCGRIKLYLR